MTTSEDDPTTSQLESEPAPATSPRLGRKGRVAAVVTATVVLLAAGVGVGLAFTGGADRAGDMTLSSHKEKAGPADGRRRGGGTDPARQAWAHQYGQNRTDMPNLPDVASASPQQQAAAAELLSRTEAATATYADPARAQAAGYDLQASLARAQQRKPGLARAMQQIDAGQMPERMPMLHVANKANRSDGKVLDPSAPETLMYEYQGKGVWKLIGVMFVANEAYPSAPPNPGGPITRWHYHDKHGGASLMMHIFFVPGNDLARAYALTMEGK